MPQIALKTFVTLMLFGVSLALSAQSKVVTSENLSSCAYFTSMDDLKKSVKNYFAYNDFKVVMTEDWDVVKFKKIQNATFKYNGADAVKKNPTELYESYLLEYTVTITYTGSIQSETAKFEMLVVSEPVGQKVPSKYSLRDGEGLNYDSFFQYLNDAYEVECP